MLFRSNDLLLRQRWALGPWKAQYFTARRFESNRARSPEWNRGAYLVEALGHCGACHSPRNRFMAEQTEQAFAGGTLWHEVEEGKVRRWSAVNLTSAPEGLATWSVADLEKYLASGFSRRGGTFGPMNEVVVNSTSHLSNEDVHAMAVYLKSVPGRSLASPVESTAGAGGSALYEKHCENCHGQSGRGGMFGGPPLAGSAVAQSGDPATLINVILYGATVPQSLHLGAWETMKPYEKVLSDEEVAAVANYVRGAWSNRGGLVTAQQVSEQR